jgi:hypothetical protein
LAGKGRKLDDATPDEYITALEEAQAVLGQADRAVPLIRARGRPKAAPCSGST